MPDRSLRDQARDAGAAYFFKQWGEWCWPSQLPEDAFREWDARENAAGHPDLNRPLRFGKRAAGRLLDGEEHSEIPQVGAARP